jgi:hypothetical protein
MTVPVPLTEAIHAAITGILDAIVVVYQDNDVSLPDRQYIAMNSVAHDCEQLTVAFQQMYLGPPGGQLDTPLKCDAPRSIVVQVQLARCVPIPNSRGQAPSIEQMNESTLIMTRDCMLLMEGVCASDAAQFLGYIADSSVTEPEGGIQAVQMNVVVGVP